MKKNLRGKKLGIIHAALITTRAVQKYIDEIIPEVEVIHWVDDTIQNTNFACEPGIIPKKNYAKYVQAALSQQEYGVDLILLACSTFNQAVEVARPIIDTPMLQIDRPMMDLAVQQGRRIGLLATVPTTVPSSERLLRLAAEEAGRKIRVKLRLCSEAFQVLKAGDTEKHNAMLLEEIDKLSREVDAIVLAQVSMTALEPRLGNTRVPVYNSGRTAFERVRRILESSKHDRRRESWRRAA
ncbi:MAG TPA: Asp/Glu/hydantoin racemase [Verrucomicrobia bacterium]|nr:Asp/Glu/hydantoin racemase [Verrucomicrobiota bacterium]HOP98539.1 aspartate/glutamate racemase family protein [Verrucomicrobiota bacterium]HPU55072.1 aspartate/glutamate racemase family protein [Verrucomicrobiota bacterium]